ncbi:hypothetical protein VE03_04442 [Pseudogymnoascus sp. 23342-1-I1]|nr:hypothetical protein VE03_04442 [Pseudogymnoascus sp. 23342-1-I1]
MGDTGNPLASASLKRPLDDVAVPEQVPADATGTAETVPSNGLGGAHNGEEALGSACKRPKLEGDVSSTPVKSDSRDGGRGVAMIKAEYLIHRPAKEPAPSEPAAAQDDEAEGKKHKLDDRDNRDSGDKKKKKKERGQNTSRNFGSSNDLIKLCNSIANSSEFSPKPCSFGERCNLGHDLRKYLKEGKREDLTTFNGKCPVWEVNGRCYAGWKCRFVSSHMEEIEREDGRKELVLTIDPARATAAELEDEENRAGVANIVSTADKLDLARRRFKTVRSDQYNTWLEKETKTLESYHNQKKGDTEDLRAQFIDPPFRASEKRRLYYGPETPILAPLTTQGNLPFRRLCVELGAEITYSEMAMSESIIKGGKGEWALMKAHESELTPPRYTPTSTVQNYDNAKDLKFGVQISSSKPWMAFKATEALVTLVPNLRSIDLNCGCPIELVYQTGAGSGLLDAPSKLEKMIRGMNAVSLDIPITAKIRMGTRDNKPTATKTIERLAFGGLESRDRLGPPGCAAITLHGRSRQQRYTKSADWSYIAECAAQIKSYHKKKDELTDTINEPDARDLPNGEKLYFIGNGDCYSHVDYFDHVQNGGVDSVMLARGALIKPWLFEEIQAGQYIDKSSTERLAYIEKFARYGLDAWGSDEMGVGQTRRFLLEWLSFAHRYVPVGILDHLPPSLQDRPPAYRSRDDLETLLASANYKDWIKISEMFLGPAHKDFQFQPKHKSNSYEGIEAEG